MHVYISVDMEGIAGIATLDQIVRGGHGYKRAQALMTAEANAAIAGAFDAGAQSVLVNDSHGTMDNFLHAELDPRARVLFGSPKLQCMAEGLTAEHDVALFVGYHAPAGGPGVLAHTFSALFTDVRLRRQDRVGKRCELALRGYPRRAGRLGHWRRRDLRVGQRYVSFNRNRRGETSARVVGYQLTAAESGARSHPRCIQTSCATV